MSYKEFPDYIIPITVQFNLIQPSFDFPSSFTGVSQYIYQEGAYWECIMSFNAIDKVKGRRFKAFLTSLQGKYGVCKVYDRSRDGAPAKGTPYASGNNQDGRILVTGGWLSNQLVLAAGDLFTINDELKEVEEDVWSDEIGFASIVFNPPLRKLAQSGDEIITKNPYMLAGLSDNSAPATVGAMGIHSFDDITFTEKLYKV